MLFEGISKFLKPRKQKRKSRITTKQRVYQLAKGELGVEEIVGPQDNPRVVNYFKTIGQGWVTDDETAWCAAFVGAILVSAGITSTGKLNARSYMQFGKSVPLGRAEQGDIAVFWRGKKDGWQGHVAFFDHYDSKSDTIYVLGGNQGNKVSIAGYSAARLLGVREIVD